MLKLKPDFVSKAFAPSKSFLTESKKFFDLLKDSRSILISSTLTSDGDSIGAQLGLLDLILKLRKGKKTTVRLINQSVVPDRYKFLKNSNLILSWDEWLLKKETIEFDLGVVCDGGVERTGIVQPLFEKIKNCVLVDHHAIGSELKYASRILDLTSSSSCELVYHLYERAKLKVSSDVAEALYIGMVFDTGFFKHSLTTPRTHLVAAKLIETGIDFSKICDRALLDRTLESQYLLQSLLNQMEVLKGGRIVTSYWTLDDFEKIKPKDGDQEGMINQLYYTETAEVVALFVERENDVKISFRSKGRVNVAAFARKLNPSGGGHVRAAGCTMDGDLREIKSQVLAELSQIVDQLI